jgi:hypothetical protein
MSDKPLIDAFINKYEQFCIEKQIPHYTKFRTEITNNIIDLSTEFSHAYAKNELNSFRLRREFIREYGFSKLVKIIIFFDHEELCNDFLYSIDATIDLWIHAVLLHIVNIYVID